ncbi:MAG: DUF1513 domain-containing protein [Alphaproteobacteria bacterium]
MGLQSDRRGVFMLAAGAAVAAGAAARSGLAATPRASYFVPGYVPDAAFRRGTPLVEDDQAARAIPDGYGGPMTMVSRIDPTAESIRRAVLPFAGHAIAVHPTGGSALFVAMNGPVSFNFDAESLDVVRSIEAHDHGYVFGGHAVFARERGVVLVTERRDTTLRFTGSAAEHYGRISVRDADSLAVLDVWDCQGIAPHELTLTADGGHVVVANYGSTAWPADRESPVEGVDYGVEPCLTVLDAANGTLVAKRLGPDRKTEVRHVAAHRLDRIVGLQVRATSFEDAQRRLRRVEGIYERDSSERDGLGYLPVPFLLADATAETEAPRTLMADDPMRMIRGQSIIADPIHDEAIATFTTSNTIAVVGGDGSLRRLIATDRLGLHWPRGIALLPDGVHYAVAGDWENIFIFRRGDHALVREACVYATLFGHSHITAAA